MRLKIEFNMDNAAFAGDWHVEAARILRFISEELEESTWQKAGVYDVNGNRVGEWKTIGRAAK